MRMNVLTYACAILLVGRSTSSPLVQSSKEKLEIHMPDGQLLKFDPFYLRERCTSSSSVNVETLQPLYNPHEFADDMAFSNATVDENNTLKVSFTDGHTSEFQLTNLIKELADFRQNPIQPIAYDFPKREPWKEGHQVKKFNYNDVVTNEESKFLLLKELLVQGAIVISDIPKESGILVNIAKQLSTMKETEWGLYFNIRTIPDNHGNTSMLDLAYTPKAIGLHTDNSFRFPAPDFTLLHALVHCNCGDEKPAPCPECSVMNYMVDGFVIAERLQRENPEYYDLMGTVPVRFESTAGDGGSALLHFGPHFEMEMADAQGNKALKGVRFGAKAGQYAPPMESEKASKFYKARRRFSELLQMPEYRVNLQMKEGEMLIMDNHRILHARTRILPTDGERNVQGGYMDRDGVELSYERLRRRYQ